MLGWDVARSYGEAMAFLDKSRRAFETKQEAVKQH